MNERENPINGPGVNSSPPSVHTAPAKSPLGFAMKIVVGTVGLVIVGAGVVLGAHIWDPLWNPFSPSPEKVIAKMAEKIGEMKTYHSDIKIDINEIGEEPGKILINLNGDSDITDSQNPKEKMNFDFRINNEKEGLSLSLIGQIKTIKDNFYFKLDKLGLPGGFGFYLNLFGIDENKFIGQWIKLDKKVMENFGIAIELSKEQQEKINERVKKLFEEKKIYNVKKRMPDEEVRGEKAYHYLLSLDREKIKEVIPELFSIAIESSGRNPEDALEGLGTDNMDKLTQEIDKFLEKTGGLDIEVWIGKKDFFLYRVKIEKEIEASVFNEGTNDKITISSDLNLSNFNIGMPDKFLDLDEVLSELFNKFQFPAESQESSSVMPLTP